ncbi:MAG: AAA family ATPase, partial [Pseudomonadota bacterium]
AIDIWGIGFKTADRIAAELGVSPTSPERAAAGVLHVLGEASSDGHVFLPRSELVAATATLLGVEQPIVVGAVEEAVAAERIVVRPIVAGGGGHRDKDKDKDRDAVDDVAVYLRSLHVAEAGAAAIVHGLVGAPIKPITIDVEKAIAWFEEKQRIELAEEQRQAIRSAVVSKVLVITGGPGTGKTTLVNGIIQILEKKGRQIQLAAPTGRAAKRLTETTGREAKTIHRCLEFDPKTMAFQRNKERPLEADVVIVDEASMVDAVLAYNLLKAIPKPCQLVLVGDVDQLPSVGPGSVLAEIIGSGRVPVVRLSHIFRQAEQSLIVVSAHRINRGKMPILDSTAYAPAAPAPAAIEDTAAPATAAIEDTAAPATANAGAVGPMAAVTAGATAATATIATSSRSGSSSRSRSDFFFVEKKEPEGVLEAIKHLVHERIPRKFGLDPVDAIQVLTPMHRGLLGATNLNSELQTLLNPAGATIVRGSHVFRVGDKVMQIRNNYDLEVFNGDVGRIESIDETERIVRVTVDGRIVDYDYATLDELVLAYACSIHKSQGSEYPCVVIPVHTQHYVMLKRNLLYTGITRGRRLVVLVGTKRALAIAVKNDTVDARHTQLAALLRENNPFAPFAAG